MCGFSNLLYPMGAFAAPSNGQVRPQIETQQRFIAPLLRLVAQGRIPAPTFDAVPAHNLGTEVFVLAGPLDEAVDYRTSIAFAYMYPHSVLYVNEDNHSFRDLESAGLTSLLIRHFSGDRDGRSTVSSSTRGAAKLQWHGK
jgi:hypothetical protein